MASSRSKKAQRNTILVRVICITLAALMILSVAAAVAVNSLFSDFFRLSRRRPIQRDGGFFQSLYSTVCW